MIKIKYVLKGELKDKTYKDYDVEPVVLLSDLKELFKEVEGLFPVDLCRSRKVAEIHSALFEKISFLFEEVKK